jgi:hypothetical protein
MSNILLSNIEFKCGNSIDCKFEGSYHLALEHLDKCKVDCSLGCGTKVAASEK